MIRTSRLTALAAVVAVAAAGAALMATRDTAAQPRPEQWKKVDDAVNKGLPKTAVEALEPIIASAMADKAYPEAIKAIGKKIALEGTIQGNKPEEKITRMEAEIAKAPAEMKPAMQAILADWYWHYFQQNRWRFVRRTRTAEAPGKDFTTWDLPRLFDEIDKHFTAALASEKELRAIPVGTYDALLEKGTVPDAYRPTLFDFVAHEALAFYESPEQAGAKAEDAFELEANSPAFAPAAEFGKWNPATTDAESRTLKAVRLYLKLLAIHADDKDVSAHLDADLGRLHFAFNKAVGEEKNARYKDALAKLADAHGDHDLSSTARFQIAGVLDGDGDKVAARKVAAQGRDAHPESNGGKLCANLVAQIEARNVQVTTERVWADPQPDIKVTYRNITKVHFKLVKVDYADRLKTARWRPEQLTDDDRKVLLARKADHEWAADLPATADYKDRTEPVAPPKGVAPGFYVLLASPAATFAPTENVVSGCDVWVSDLALVARHEWGKPRVAGFVLDGRTGDPVAGAKVQLWTRDNGRGDARWLPHETGTTDANGRYDLKGLNNHAHLVLASKDKDQLASGNDYYVSEHNPGEHAGEQTVFFTDRALYRPGQTVQYKGICVRSDHGSDTYATVAKRSVTVVFADVNGKEIAKQQVTTNDVGSFSGSFTAPRDRLTGRMSLQALGAAPGATQVSVEEYKRPKFLVTADAPKEPAKLNAEVKVPVKAVGYTGVPVGGAKVRFRVVREVRLPYWWYECYGWWRPQPRQGAQEIAHGTAVSDADGTFTVAFTAKPDLTVKESDEPTFRYTVHADVTDTTGETRSASRSVEVGYVGLRATVSAGDWLTEDAETKLAVTTTSLDGEGRAAEGTLKVFKLKQPEKVARPEIDGGHRPYRLPTPAAGADPKAMPVNPAKPATWETDGVAFEAKVTTDGAGKAGASVKLPAGPYRAVFETKDAFGKAVTARAQLDVLNPTADRFPTKIPDLVAAPKWSLQPGEKFLALWGTGYDTGRAFVEIEHRGKLVQSFWTAAGKTQATVTEPVTEAMRGGFTLRVTHVRDNRAYLTSRRVDVPWTNKNLTVKWEHFTSKLEPGKKETFTAVITGPDGKRAAAEVVAALYDQSLDAYQPHHWQAGFGVFRQDHSHLQYQFENGSRYLNHLAGHWTVPQQGVAVSYRHFPHELTANLWGYQWGEGGGRGMSGGFGPGGPPPPMASAPMSPVMEASEKQQNLRQADGGLQKAGENRAADAAGKDDKPGDGPAGPNGPGPNLDAVAARKNLSETAFFFPHLTADGEGTVRMEFTMPEALTKWKFLGFAHDKALRAGLLQDEVVTAKDLMAQPNPPRFLREGDKIEFAVKLSNKSATRQAGKVRLAFKDARTDQPADAALGNAVGDQPFELAAGESKTVFWPLAVSEGTQAVTYKVVAATDRLSDGEEGALPVLSNRVLVAESLPLPIRGPGTKTFEFRKLLESRSSNTLRSQSLTVQMTSQPAWYAVLALPYLMEYPHECFEQSFNRLYANSLARHVANSDPKIRRVFDQWKNTPALDSPLEKNQDLKAVMLDETPWVRQAAAESAARRNVGVLFDANRLDEETARLTRKMAEGQNPDGLWSWFPGGRGNEYMTLYITTGYGRLRHLGAKVDTAAAVKSLARLDQWMDERYQHILRHGKPDENHLSNTIALYLYGRSFFLADQPVAEQHATALAYWRGQAKKYWLALANRQGQAHIAVGLKRFGDKETPQAIMKSIKERSVSNEELGMFWRDTEISWWWYHAPIETQAMMVEAFDEVMNDKQAVEDCQVWLLKQKQTQDWKTTKATADAVYALLLRGNDLLKSDALVEVSLGGEAVKPEKVEAGTGFYEQKFVRGEVKPEMGTITVKKTDPGVAWGGVHWQYLEDVTKVTPHDGTPLKLEKALFKRVFTKKGPTLEPITGPLAVGDEVVCRVVLRTDRDMEYVHLKDHRGSGTEPVNVLSSYKYQDGLAYYESTKDAATHFFIDYLPKGVYVFEYAVRVQHKGSYPSGLAHIECMYAPEFNSHSASVPLEVK